MDHFPVSSSNLSASHLSPFLQEKYGLSRGTCCRFIKAGVNDSYLVEDGGDRFIFRIYSLNWRTRQEIQEEIRLLNLLKDRQQSVSYPVPDIHENYIQLLKAPEGERPGVLFVFAEGEKLPAYSDDMHFKAGVMMAELHGITQNLSLNRVTYTEQVLLEDSFEQLQLFLSKGTPERDFMESIQAYLLQVLKNAQTEELRKGTVHLDIWFDNMNITPEGTITLFDFDFCGNGWLCLDLAYYILQLHNIEKEEDECRRKTDSFLAGYESITPVTNEERRLIPALGVSLYFFYLGIQCRRFDNWSNTFLNETYLKRFINVLVKKYFELYFPKHNVLS